MYVENKKKKEIGGFFEFPFFDCNDPSRSILHYLTTSAEDNNYAFVRDGRQAIRLVLQGIKHIQERNCYLPAYLCRSILQPFQEMGLNVHFYGHQHPLIQNIDEDVCDSVIFIIDYFGTEFVVDKRIRKLLQQGNCVIVDVTHSILDKEKIKLHHENLYYISSLRKIFPIPDGAVIFHSHNDLGIDVDSMPDYTPMLDAMVLKNLYLYEGVKSLNIYNSDLKKLYLSLYAAYEENKDQHIVQISKIPIISVLILANLTFDTLLKRRSQNLLTVYERVSDDEIFLFSCKDIKSPFMVPLYLQNNTKRELVKHMLLRNNVYPPIHWQLKGVVPETFEYEHHLSSSILSIPIDQRYSIEDMINIANILNEATL